MNAFYKLREDDVDITPSRDNLVHTMMKEDESFKAYATRWRGLAAWISPEPTEKELMDLFMKAFPCNYQGQIFSSTAESFDQLVLMGKSIEVALRDEEITEQDSIAEKFLTVREEHADKSHVT